MNEPNRTQWQIRCAFNGFCKRTLKNEAINAHGEIKRRQLQEVSFSDLTPQEENQLYTYDTYFEHDEAEKSFCVAGKEITAKLLAEALHSLPDDKREAVLLYYFFEMNDAEIAKLRDVPRSTIMIFSSTNFSSARCFPLNSVNFPREYFCRFSKLFLHTLILPVCRIRTV